MAERFTKVTLWYRHDKKLDIYKYNHAEFDRWFAERVPEGSTPENNRKFKTSRWLSEFAYLQNGVIIYDKRELNEEF